MASRRAAALGFLLTLSAFAPAASATLHQVIVGESGVLNVWPGPDGQIGTADDVTNGNPSPVQGSDANDIASYSFNAFQFGAQPESTLLPSPMDASTFLQGTLDVDETVAASGGGPIVTAMTLMGTEPFQFHGPYTATILTVNSGTYDPGTRAFALNVDFLANFGGPPSQVSNFSMTGSAWHVPLPSAAVGNAYVDNVLIPLATSLNATSLFYLRGQGTVPQSDDMFFGPFNVDTGVVAIVVPEPSAVALAWSGVGVVVGLRQRRRRRGVSRGGDGH